ncbi:helix-turn-helix domain-containing protein [Arthrobacter sulfonylureivorans]|uniref:helix-turn-helix domain-containing protein n=1 Tax=Arthrobacter sulfonylureivorans TaxID=2486855 RepID=UPI0039E606A1
MTLGEKLKAARKKAGLSQEELAKKLSVSRQAITKWENNKGIPDVENLKALSTLFDVSVDYLLSDADDLSAQIIREPIDIAQYKKSGKERGRFDAAVRAKYPSAKVIYPLTRRRKLTTWESIVDFVIQPGTLNAADSLRDLSGYYVVDLGDRHLLVNVSKEFVESRELTAKFDKRKQVIGDNVFTKAPYTL